MPYTKPVTVKAYCGTPIWIDHEVPLKEYIILSAQSSTEEVELFLSHLYEYNDIDVNRSLEESFNDLLIKERLCYQVELLFLKMNRK